MVNDDFSYDIKNDDNSIYFVRNKENFFGYDKTYPTLFSNNLIGLFYEIVSNKEITENFEYSKKGRDIRFVKASKRLWKELEIELQKVQYIKPSLNFDEDKFDGVMTKEFCDGLAFDYPTKIPIVYVDDYLKVNSNPIFLEGDKYNAILFRSISLPKVEKKINSCIYAHEITHTEQDYAGGGIKKVTNAETLPIFIELLFSNKIDESSIVTDQIKNRRLVFLASTIIELIENKEMNFERRIKLETYLISIIQALDLYNKYCESDERTKKEFIESINKIFTGEMLVEDMLNNYDSNYYNVEPKLKVLKRN